MTSIADTSVCIQTSSESVPSTPSWFGEVALAAIGGYLEAHHLSPSCALLRLDGQYGTGVVIADLAGFSFVMRGKDYTVLDRESVQSRLGLRDRTQAAIYARENGWL